MSFSDLAGLLGVALMLGAYAGAALDKLTPTGAPALLLNLAGALLVLFSLTQSFNLPAFILETVWALVAVIGLARLALSRKAEGEVRRDPDL
jgi:hypothetical protein